MDARAHGQREPQSLEAWESWVDHLIVEAQERGEFDNLPGHGKPLQLEDAPFANGLEVGFGMLKNAGVAPYWVELEKEIRTKTTLLEKLMDRAAHLAREQAVAPDGPPPVPDVSRRRWWPFRRREARTRPVPAVSWHLSEIARLRREYLEQAAEREKLIGQYNAAIPRDLWHLERPRQAPEEAAQAFDRAIESARSRS